MSWEAIGTHSLAFLLGAAAGAAGQYFADKYTDRRRKQESESEEDRAFRKLAERMPELFQAIRADMDKDPNDLVREFFVLHSPGVTLGFARPHFRYNESEIENLRAKVDLLADAAFVEDVTGDGARKYRLAEHFVERLRKRK